MSKELTPLKAHKELKSRYGKYFSLQDDERAKVIETTLKNYEELTSKPVILCRRTHEEAQKLIDIICKNYKEVKITNLEDENKVKAFEIIKEKRVDVDWFIECLSCGKPLEVYNDRYDKIRSCDGKNYHFMKLAQEEYDLLKKVLL